MHSPSHYHYYTSLSLTALTTLFLSLIVCFRSVKDPVNRLLALLLASIAGWSFGQTMVILASGYSARDVLFWGRLAHAPIVFIPTFFVHFVYVAVKLKQHKKIVNLAYALSAIFLLSIPSHFFIRSAIQKLSFRFFITAGPLYYLMFLFFFLAIGYGLNGLYYGYKRSVGVKRNQLKYLFWASLLGFLSGLPNALLVFGFEIYPLNPFSTYAVGISVITIAYAVIRYRLMDVAVYAAKSTIFFSSSLLVVFSSLGLSSYARDFLIRKLGDKWWYVPVLGSMFLAASAYVLSGYFVRKLDERRLRKLREAQDSLESSGKGMIEIDDVERLSGIIPRYLTRLYRSKLGMKISHLTIFLFDDSKGKYMLAASAGKKKGAGGNTLEADSPLCKWFIEKSKMIIKEGIASPKDLHVLRIDDIDYWMANNKLLGLEVTMRDFLGSLKQEMERLRTVTCVPIFFKEKLLGILLLGSREEGIYSAEELDLFSHFAANAATALRSAELSGRIRKFGEEKAEADKLVAIGELLGCVRHEIGNLINIISANTQMMTETYIKGDKNKFEELRTRVVNNTISVKDIWGYVDDYNDKSRSNMIALFNLRDITEKALSGNDALLEKWNISVASTIDPRITMKGKSTLPDIFKHLVTNACYGMENYDTAKSGGKLTLSAEVNNEKNEVRIVQADSGTDLTNQKRSRMLAGGKLFAQQGKLGGINFFLAGRMIADHKGFLDIQSNEGKGTRFVVRLPLDFTKVSA